MDSTLTDASFFEETLRSWPVVLFGCSWLVAELLFYAVFRCLFVPRANRHRPAHPYRPPFHTAKHQLLRRIVQRIRNDVTEPEDLREVVTTFLQSWFRPKKKQQRAAAAASTAAPKQSVARASSSSSLLPGAIPLTKRGSTLTATTHSEETGSVSSLASSTDDSFAGEAVSLESSSSSTWTIPGIYQTEMDAFLAWGMWGKSLSKMTAADLQELQNCYDVLRNELQLGFPEDPDKSHHQLEPRLLSLDPVNALHRPLAVYLACFVFRRVIPGIVLRLARFQRVRSATTGLTGWYRAGRRRSSHTEQEQRMPLLFFHGIAPGGLLFYLPMILWGLLGGGGDDDRPCFLFENKNIAATLDFAALDESEVVAGVQEIVEEHLPDKTGPLAACGHSFGSCQLTWLLLSSTPEFRQRIRQYVLLDPVTVLLSDPDVMVNFLYSTEASKIRLLASSELFTEYYLRRHFAWYNSELWLEDMWDSNDDDRHVVIALAEEDEIVNSPKVKKHIDLFVQKTKPASKLSTVYWKGAKHAACVTDPRKWRDIRTSMLQSELKLVRKSKQQ